MFEKVCDKMLHSLDGIRGNDQPQRPTDSVHDGETVLRLVRMKRELKSTYEQLRSTDGDDDEIKLLKQSLARVTQDIKDALR